MSVYQRREETTPNGSLVLGSRITQLRIERHSGSEIRPWHQNQSFFGQSMSSSGETAANFAFVFGKIAADVGDAE